MANVTVVVLSIIVALFAVGLLSTMTVLFTRCGDVITGKIPDLSTDPLDMHRYTLQGSTFQVVFAFQKSSSSLAFFNYGQLNNTHSSNKSQSGRRMDNLQNPPQDF
ncbi:hypothetical protein LSH36_1114g00056 [Paralvinella palmiformis]|uniref:Uncharacterized protein n=1 Tax=Paralvinella palmiformis TaxID=53620 RepID=A0AAD9IVI2_9ANNE|nr:hypothetical protein LSH36_1114g00056 [Paralvinella palmiformis]